MADRLKRHYSWGRAAILSECENKASATGHRNDFVSAAVIGYRYRRRRLGLEGCGGLKPIVFVFVIRV
jgi:hypothetical protein